LIIDHKNEQTSASNLKILTTLQQKLLKQENILLQGILVLPWLELYAMVIEFVKKRSITKNKGIEACILANHAYNNKKIQGDNHGMTPMES
jgi:hypothetical protein